MRLLFVLAFALGLYAAPAQKIPPREIKKSLPLYEGKHLFLETGVGDITIRPGQARQAEVLARIEADGTCDDNRERVEKTSVLVDPIPEGLRIRTVQDKSKPGAGVLEAFIKTCEAPRVHYTLTLPKSTKLDLRAERSSIDVQDMDADLRIRVPRGRLMAKGLAGAADVELKGGEVRLSFRSFPRPSRVQMTAGMLEVSLPKNTKLDLNYDGNPRAFRTDFQVKPGETARINGGGPRLDLISRHGWCRVIASEPVAEPKPAPVKKAAAKRGK